MTGNKRWTILCDKSTLDGLRNDKGFWQLTAFARAVNSLRFVQAPLDDSQHDDTPSGQRLRMNSFLFTCALLYEAMLLVETMNPYWGRKTSFAGLHGMLKDKNIVRIRQYHLDDLRNQAVFHFRFVDELGAKIAADKGNHYVFAVVGENETRKQVYYPSADIHALEILVGGDSTDAKFIDKLKQIMKETTAFAVRFLNVADEFIDENLSTLGFYLQED